MKEGDRFNKLTFIKFNGKDPIYGDHLGIFKCDCGNTKSIALKNVRLGRTKSCGCLRGVDRNGESKTKIYSVWKNMHYRCKNKKCIQYKDYGGRKITICKEWDNFLIFKKWALANGYQDGLTIDRIDNNGNYKPSNCRFVTMAIQLNNKRNNIKIITNNEITTIKELAKKNRY